jgi:hypothetical protein
VHVSATLADHGSRGPAAHPCGDARQQLGVAWDESRRLALRASFARAAVPYADDGRREVERVVDDYARQWTAMRSPRQSRGTSGFRK